jgi:hypothetical protein
MLSNYATNEVNSWMNSVVIIRPGRDPIHGSYDGYGRVDCYEISWDDGCCCYHEACWVKAGRPVEWIESETSDDQGFFFDDPEHDMKCPAIRDYSGSYIDEQEYIRLAMSLVDT